MSEQPSFPPATDAEVDEIERGAIETLESRNYRLRGAARRILKLISRIRSEDRA